jgi:uncharacterized protein involved in exopolysaccharide biosynthesis
MSATTFDNDDITIDQTVALAVWKRRVRLWIVATPILLTLFMLRDLFFTPQVYSSRTSLSVQQPSAASSSLSAGLASLTGMSVGPRKYMGIVRSRRIAIDVARLTNLHKRLGLPTPEHAAGLIMRSLKADDNAVEGLLYITVNLEGPARIVPGRAVDRQIYNQASADVANAYAKALAYYYINTDNDAQLVVYRNAKRMADKAQQEYDNALERLRGFFESDLEPKTETLASGNSPLLGQLQQLSIELGKVEADILSLRAGKMAYHQLLNDQLKLLDILPGEDKLLRDARISYQNAKAELEDLRLSLADEHPRVVLAKERVRLAGMRLKQERQGILQGRTSEQIREEVEQQRLKARYDELTAQMRKLRRRLRIGQSDALTLETLRDDVSLKFNMLREAATRLVGMQAQQVSGQNVVLVVDEALPASNGQPDLVMIVLRSALATVAILILWFLLEYLFRLGRPRPAYA